MIPVFVNLRTMSLESVTPGCRILVVGNKFQNHGDLLRNLVVPHLCTKHLVDGVYVCSGRDGGADGVVEGNGKNDADDLLTYPVEVPTESLGKPDLLSREWARGRKCVILTNHDQPNDPTVQEFLEATKPFPDLVVIVMCKRGYQVPVGFDPDVVAISTSNPLTIKSIYEKCLRAVIRNKYDFDTFRALVYRYTARNGFLCTAESDLFQLRVPESVSAEESRKPGQTNQHASMDEYFCRLS